MVMSIHSSGKSNLWTANNNCIIIIIAKTTKYMDQTAKMYVHIFFSASRWAFKLAVSICRVPEAKNEFYCGTISFFFLGRFILC